MVKFLLLDENTLYSELLDLSIISEFYVEIPQLFFIISLSLYLYYISTFRKTKLCNILFLFFFFQFFRFV